MNKWWEEDPESEAQFAERREQMVARQIERRGIRDPRILEAMRTVPRHLFVPEQFRGNAYDDSPILIGFEQTISQPFIVAYMLDALKLTGIESVLEIGTGSGYEAALLSFLCQEVYSVEIIPELADRASELLQALSLFNTKVHCSDGYKGWPAHAPFDRIIVSAAPTHVPQTLVEQMSPNGIMILPLGDQEQRLVLITRDAEGKTCRNNTVKVKFVPMTGIASTVN